MKSLPLKKKLGLRDGSVQVAASSCRGPGFGGFQHPQGSSQPSVTVVLASMDTTAHGAFARMQAKHVK